MGSIFISTISSLVGAKRSSGILNSGLTSLFPFSTTEASRNVNTNTSLTVSAFYGAVNTIANSIALLPFAVYRKDKNKRLSFEDHPADYLLRRESNQQMTAFTFKFIMAVAVMMRGNAFAKIERNPSGKISAYIYLDPDAVSIIESEGKLYYRFKEEIYSADEIVHIPGFSFDGICGKSVIEFAADNLGVILNAQKFGSDSFQDRGMSYGVLESDLSVNAKKKREIGKAFSEIMSSGNKHRAPLLDEGMTYKSITLKPEEAQFIETYAAGVEDIARWFQIPAHKLAIKGEGGYNFLQNMEIDYLHRAVMPLGEKFKQEFERKTFTFTEKQSNIYIHLNYKKLLQADPKTRAQYYKDLYYMGAINPNKIMELEDMNPREDEGGEMYVQLTNVINENQLKKVLKDEEE